MFLLPVPTALSSDYLLVWQSKRRMLLPGNTTVNKSNLKLRRLSGHFRSLLTLVQKTKKKKGAGIMMVYWGNWFGISGKKGLLLQNRGRSSIDGDQVIIWSSFCYWHIQRYKVMEDYSKLYRQDHQRFRSFRYEGWVSGEYLAKCSENVQSSFKKEVHKYLLCSHDHFQEEEL